MNEGHLPLILDLNRMWKTLPRRDRNNALEEKNNREKPKIIKETNINQRITIYFGLVVYHLVVSYLYASMAGEWMS